MSYLKRSFLIVILLVGYQIILPAQSKFFIGLTAGISIPAADYTGTTSDFYSGTSYGLNSGFSVGAVAKAKLSFSNLRFTFNYSSLSNSGNATASGGSINLKQNVFVIGAGPEFSFGVGKSKVKPYFGINILFASISGENTFSDVPRVPDGTYSTASAVRGGLGVDIGTQLDIGKKYAVDVNFQYSFLNLLGKSFNGGTNRLDSYTSLNDAEDPLFSANPNIHPIGSSRIISMFQLNLGFLFGL